MFSTKVLFLFAAFIVSIQADDDLSEEDRAIFRECAEANGLKMGSHKKGERPPGPPSPEMMCTVKCTMEKKGVLSGGKILVEEARKDPKLLKYVSADKVDAVMDCLKGLEVKECSDMQKVFACSKDVMQ